MLVLVLALALVLIANECMSILLQSSDRDSFIAIQLEETIHAC